MRWIVYILLCSNGSYYVGHTYAPSARLVRHQSGTGAQHTSTYGAEDIVYTEEHLSEADPIRRERQIKKWSRAKKEALIEGRFDDLKLLSRSRDC